MNRPSSNALFILSIILCVAVIFLNRTIYAGQFTIRESPGGLVGVSAGPSMHTGRAHVLDGVSGATLTDTRDNWKKYTMGLALFSDMGISTSKKGMAGSLGVRFLGDIHVPGRIGSFATFIRYRFQFRLSDAGLSAVEPWAGMGVGFHAVPFKSNDVFVQLPIAAGCDFGISADWLITTEIQLNSMNPIGPTRERYTEESMEIHKLRYDSYLVRMGIAYRFY